MLARLIALAFTIAMVGLPAGCRFWLPRTNNDVSTRSSSMILLDGAKETVYYFNRDERGDPWSEHISYIIDAPFPAASTVCSIVLELRARGWRPLRKAADGRHDPSAYARGWSVTPSHDKNGNPYLVDAWSTDWINANGEVVGYTLAYRYPQTGPVDRTHLRVSGLRFALKDTSERDKEWQSHAERIPDSGTTTPLSG